MYAFKIAFIYDKEQRLHLCANILQNDNKGTESHS